MNSLETTYKITGILSPACQQIIESALYQSKAIKSIQFNTQKDKMTILFNTPIPINSLNKILRSVDPKYTLSLLNKSCCSKNKNHNESSKKPSQNSLLKEAELFECLFYCPMHCEGKKTYAKSGACPVCGMDLLVQDSMGYYTCPNHPKEHYEAMTQCRICNSELIYIDTLALIEKRQFNKLLLKFKIALVFSIPVLFLSMGEMLPKNPLPQLIGSYAGSWLQFLLVLPVLFVCRMFFQRALSSFITWKLNMYSLIGVGSGAAFFFSVIGLLFPSILPNEFKNANGSAHLYFESTTMILTFMLLGQTLETKAHKKTSSSIRGLLQLSPQQTIRIYDSNEEIIPIYQVNIGDILRVKQGDKVPVDGQITEGFGLINEAMLSGEPIPAEKKPGDIVKAGTINEKFSFLMRAIHVGKNTQLAKIISLVQHARESRPSMQRIADRIVGYFVPVVFIISLVTFVIWSVLLEHSSFIYGFSNAISVLIIACPCALSLATPMSVMVGIGKCASCGILVKNIKILEKLNKIDLLAIDKTGTLTEGKAKVLEFFCTNPNKKNNLLSLAASISKHSEHILAQAVIDYAADHNCVLQDINKFSGESGLVKGIIQGQKVLLGSEKAVLKLAINIDPTIIKKIRLEQSFGRTISFLAINDRVVGCIIFEDTIKKTSKQVVQQLISLGITPVMLTGDCHVTAETIAQQLNIIHFKAECSPSDKHKYIRQCQLEGKTIAMVGDGINDSPAIAQADVGIAMGTGSDIAIDNADITLINGDISGILKALMLSQKIVRNIWQNLWFAFMYNILGIPIAAGILYPMFGILLSPMIAAFAMSLSSVSVISNSLRMGLLDIDNNKTN